MRTLATPSFFSSSLTARQALSQALKDGRHFHRGGSLDIMKSYVAPAAKAGDVQAMMSLANGYYTIAGYVGTQGLLGKCKALWYLYRALQTATDAFQSSVECGKLLRALSLFAKNPEDYQSYGLSYGDVHILMSCYVKWLENVTFRLHQNPKHQLRVVRLCHTIIMKSDQEALRVLSMGTMRNLRGVAEKVKTACENKLIRFIFTHYERLYQAKVVTAENVWLAQVVCRACRAMEHFESAYDLAKKYGLEDQAKKARAKMR